MGLIDFARHVLATRKGGNVDVALAINVANADGQTFNVRDLTGAACRRFILVDVLADVTNGFCQTCGFGAAQGKPGKEAAYARCNGGPEPHVNVRELLVHGEAYRLRSDWTNGRTGIMVGMSVQFDRRNRFQKTLFYFLFSYSAIWRYYLYDQSDPYYQYSVLPFRGEGLLLRVRRVGNIEHRIILALR